MDYKQLIEDTVVPSRLSKEEKMERYKSIAIVVNEKMPSRLYRFRKCSERNLSAFFNDQIWFSNGSAMNDDFDARLYYNRYCQTFCAKFFFR